MAYYYKVNDSENELPLHKGFHLYKVKNFKGSEPKINYDFSKHVLIELLDDTTPEADLWKELGLISNSNIIHKRMMLDSHRIKCRRAIVICINSNEAKQLVQRISQTKIMDRCICAVVIENLLSDLCLFEKQIMQFGDSRNQQQLLYVTDLSRCRGPTGLVEFLKEKFSSFGTILSVFICADDNGYAFPEGIIKFAYLSEAFAAELAFDQYVIGKERLSVTTHHNILLSQCDLRVRLRDAQWCNNLKYNTPAESFFKSCNEICEQSDLDICNEDPVVNSMNSLQISHGSDNLIDEKLQVSLPAFSQYNFKMNIPKENQYKNTVHSKKKYKNRRIGNTVSIPYANIASDLNTTDIIKNTEDSNKFSSVNNFNHKISTCLTETMPIDVNITKDVDQIKASHCHNHLNLLTSRELLLSQYTKSPEAKSDTDSFTTCKHFLSSNSNYLLPSSKNTFHNNLHFDDINSMSKYETESSICKQISSSDNVSLNGSKDVQQFLSKDFKKKRKKFTPSRKLCLKSQRTAINQSNFQIATARSDISVSSSSQPEKSLSRNRCVCKKDLCVNLATMPPDSSDSSKVTDWLSDIPVSQSTLSETDEGVDVETIIEKSVQNNKKHNNRISVYRAPSIKSNLIMSFDLKNALSNESCQKNIDLNRNPLILSEKCQPVLLTEKSKSPLQVWLKQELMSSINNRIVRSREDLKSIIVCATRTKDVIIAVGCSHITCDSCYPESTDLLLGYN